MYLQHEGIRLHAKLELPDNEAEKQPLVILVHGFTGHMEERHILAVARTLQEIGYGVLRLELYGHGQSGGSFTTMTLKSGSRSWFAPLTL